MKSKIKWYFKQLLPLQYRTEYIENGINKLTIWRMWFGYCFSIANWDLVNNTELK